MEILEIQPSPRGESSDSIAVAKPFSEARRSDNTSVSRTSVRGNILMLDRGISPDPRNEPQRLAQSQLKVGERMSAIGRMACSISHDSVTAC